MPKRSSKRKKRPDINELAHSIVEQATDESPPEEPETPPVDPNKDPAAVALGRKGGLKGGKARAAKMTPEERSESARKAANARWKKKRGKD
jgi:hypothetical protein